MFDSQSDSYFNSETESRSYLNFNASELYWSFLFNYFKELIIFALFFIVMAAIWLRTIPCFLVINRNLKAEWEKIYSFFRDNIHLNQNFQLPEFAITNHAHYVIKNYFVKVMVGSVVFALFVLYLYFRFPHFYIFEFLLLIPLAIFVTTWSILAYISTIFAQVYQVLVVIFIFEQCWKMGKDEPEQTRNQIARKQFVTKDIIRTLYICCILRDFVLYPLIWYMSINSLFDLIFVSMNTEEVSVRAQLTYPRVFDLISTESIFFLVPISVLYYLYRRQNLTNKEHAKNPLQVYIFKQAMIMVAIKAIIIAIFSVMFLIDKNLSWFLTASRMDLILVVVAVQISAMICFRKRLIAYQQNPPQEIFMTRLPPIINEPPPDY